jgi:peptidoglycan/LPS O-acetylase OafA/YrhL
MKYRADIDGLRAIAVLSVVAFHAFPGKITGGFIGVDIFFVISGFLISSILFSNLAQAKFSIIGFYNRRIRRIFPSLITVMLTSLIFGWFVLLADEYKQLGTHIAGGVGFVSNLLLLSENGYFDNAAESKPMLHLWSLAIEEQFYIFWPLLIAFIWKRRWNFWPIIAAIAIGSFAANIYTIGSNPTAVFYSPIYRFWELTIGGILAYLTLHRPELLDRHQNAQSVSGFAFLIIGLILINKDRQFPGWWALLPTMGAFLLISAGSTAWINKKILSNQVLVWFGLISYPLYLWHWPLLSFAKILEGNPNTSLKSVLVVASVVLAWLTCQFIEKPLRFSKHPRTPLLLLLTFLFTGLVGYSCLAHNGYEGLGFRDREKTEFANYFENGLPERRYLKRENMSAKYREQCNFYNLVMDKVGKTTKVPIDEIAKECYVGDPAIENFVMIWGDSHAAHLYIGLQHNLPQNWQVLQVTSSKCEPDTLSPGDSNVNYCQRSNWFALKTIADKRPNAVIVAQNIGHDAAKMSAIGAKLESLGIENIIFNGPTVHWNTDFPKIILRKLWHNTPQKTFVGIDNEIFQANQVLKQQFKSSPSGHFVSIIDYFCDRTGCLTHIGADRERGITSWDYGHLTPIASEALAQDVLVPLVTKSSHK